MSTSKIIKPGETAKIELEISCTKKLVLTDEDEWKIKKLVKLYLEGKINYEK